MSDTRLLAVHDESGRLLLALQANPDGTLDARYHPSDLTDAARELVAVLRTQWAQACAPGPESDEPGRQLRRLLTARATDWWRHHVPLSTTMRVPQPDMVVLGHQLGALFPTVMQEYIGDAPPPGSRPQRWQRRLIAYTGLHPSDPPPPLR